MRRGLPTLALCGILRNPTCRQTHAIKPATGTPSHRHWARNVTDGLTRYDGAEFVTYTTVDGLEGNNAVLSLLEDGSGHLWIGTWRDGLSRYDGKGSVTYTTQDGLAHNTVYSLLEDQAGQVWLGTGGGLSRYDGAGFVTYTTGDGLADSTVISLGCNFHCTQLQAAFES